MEENFSKNQNSLTKFDEIDVKIEEFEKLQNKSMEHQIEFQKAI